MVERLHFSNISSICSQVTKKFFFKTEHEIIFEHELDIFPDLTNKYANILINRYKNPYRFMCQSLDEIISSMKFHLKVINKEILLNLLLNLVTVVKKDFEHAELLINRFIDELHRCTFISLRATNSTWLSVLEKKSLLDDVYTFIVGFTFGALFVVILS